MYGRGIAAASYLTVSTLLAKSPLMAGNTKQTSIARIGGAHAKSLDTWWTDGWVLTSLHRPLPPAWEGRVRAVGESGTNKKVCNEAAVSRHHGDPLSVGGSSGLIRTSSFAGLPATGLCCLDLPPSPGHVFFPLSTPSSSSIIVFRYRGAPRGPDPTCVPLFFLTILSLVYFAHCRSP